MVCDAGMQLLFSTDFAQSLQQDWLSGQFSCRRCASSLVGQRYILRDDQPYCKNCYEQLFANTCFACKTPITTDYKVRLRGGSKKKYLWKAWPLVIWEATTAKRNYYRTN